MLTKHYAEAEVALRSAVLDSAVLEWRAIFYDHLSRILRSGEGAPMSSEVPEHLLGTQQHRNARDLSEYLVHMTTTPQALASIITSGRIEARKPFGIGRSLRMVEDKHKAVCFTEMPLSELDRLRDRCKA